MNPLKNYLEKFQPSIGAWLNSGSPLIAEAMVSCGFKWLVIDMEHSATDLSQVEAIFVSAERWGVSPLVRIGTQDSLLACRLLDCGAHGLIVSKVEDARKFEEFIAKCVYPPNGSRGVGLGRANVWGDKFQEYFKDFTPVILPMIETRKGVEESDYLAANPLVDGLFLGPYDLSADCGSAGDMESENFKSAVATVKQSCAINQKKAGIHQVYPDFNELNRRINEGFGIIAFGTDLLAVRQSMLGVAEFNHDKTNKV